MANYHHANDKYFHFEFDSGRYVIVLMDLLGPKKEIDIRDSDLHNTYRLTWNVTDNKGFEFEFGTFYDRPNGWSQYATIQSAKYNANTGKLTGVNNDEYVSYSGGMIDILSQPEKESALPVSLLTRFNSIMKSLPFKKSLEEIMGSDDIKDCGLAPVFEVVNLIEKFKEIIQDEKNRKIYGGHNFEMMIDEKHL